MSAPILKLRTHNDRLRDWHAVHSEAPNGLRVAASANNVWVEVRSFTREDVEWLRQVDVLTVGGAFLVQGVYNDEAWSAEQRAEYINAWECADLMRGIIRDYAEIWPDWDKRIGKLFGPKISELFFSFMKTCQ